MRPGIRNVSIATPFLCSLIVLPTLTHAQDAAPQLPPANQTAPQIGGQAANPFAQALVTGVRERAITLGIGSDDGLRVGAIYELRRAGQPTVRAQVTAVRPAESDAALLGDAGADDTNVVTLGDTLDFVEVQPLQVPAAPTIPTAPTTPQAPTIPTTPVVPPAFPTTPNSTTPNTTTPATPTVPATPIPFGTPVAPLPPSAPFSPLPTAPMAAQNVFITAVEGTQIRLSAGSTRGIVPGVNLPVLRGGNAIALIRITQTQPDSSVGELVFRDPNFPAPASGDFVSVPQSAAPDAATGSPSDVFGPIESDAPPVAVAPIRFETGASDAIVPRADRTYEYLAALASARLITRYPAHVFHDDGSRFHRTDEDITFTRAQIADLVREALSSEAAAQDGGAKGGARVALSSLVVNYAQELRQLGVTSETLTALTPNKGFAFGSSGQSRATLATGSTQNVVDPFSERQGGRRSRSGFDSRFNLFAQSGGKLQFFGQIDTGSDPRRPANVAVRLPESISDNSFLVRKALVSYDANTLLRGLTVEAGRNEFWWGPGHFGTLLLGDTAGPLNSIRTLFRRGSYQFESLYAPLGTGPNGGSRSFYGHNLQLRIGSQTRVGLAETVVAPSSSLNPVLFASTFSPIPLFFAERLRNPGDAADNGNLLGSVYFETSVARGASGYGEFLFDDTGITPSNLTRSRFATLVGLHLFSPRDPAKMGIYGEFTSLQGQTYLRFGGNPDAAHFYRNRPLGYPVTPTFDTVGGGAESLRFDAYYRLSPKLRLGGGLEFADINSEDNVVPGRVLSRQQIYRFRASYDLSSNFTLTARAQRVATAKPNFVQSEAAITQRLFSLEVARSF